MHVAAALVLVGAVLAAFAPALGAELLNWDDDQLLLRNQAWVGEGSTGFAFSTGSMGHYQPLTWLSYRLDGALWGVPRQLGDAAAHGFHRTSVLLHALTALAFYGLALQILRRVPAFQAQRDSPLLPWTALLAALLFALHPMRAESVAWVTERRDVLSGALLVLATAGWLRGVPACAAPGARVGWGALAAVLACGACFAAVRLGPASLSLRSGGAALLALSAVALGASAWWCAPGGRGLALVAVGLALASLLGKAWGIVLPAVLLVLDAWPLQRMRGRAALGLALEKAPFLALSVVFGALAAWAQSTQPGTLAGVASHSPGERALQALHGLAWYPLATVLPLGLAPFHALPQEVRLAEPRFLVPALLVPASIAALFALRRRAPALAAAFGAYALIVSPVLGLLQSGQQLVAPRYSYLATLPLALLAAGGSAWLLVRRPAARVAASAGWVLVLVALALLTRKESGVWADSESLWRRGVARGGGHPLPAAKLAQVHLDAARSERDARRRSERTEQARTALASATWQADPTWLATDAQVHQFLAELEPQRRAEHLAAALARNQEAMELAGGASASPDYMLNTGSVLMALGRAQDALPLFARAVELRPDLALARNSLGSALAAAGRPADARRELEHAVRLDPGYAKAWNGLALLCETLGDRAAAAAAWRRLLELWPEHPTARERLRALEAGR